MSECLSEYIVSGLPRLASVVTPEDFFPKSTTHFIRANCDNIIGKSLI